MPLCDNHIFKIPTKMLKIELEVSPFHIPTTHIRLQIKFTPSVKI